MAAETQYTANTGMVEISTANTNLDGTGTLGTVITGASNGTLIKSITVKATTNTTQGMVRLFIYDGANTRLFHEINIPIVTKSSEDPAFQASMPTNFTLESGHILKASTEVANTFNVIAEGLDYAYYASSVRPESTNYTSKTGVVLASAANTNLDGSGTLATIVTAGVAGSSWKGLAVSSVSIKAQGTVTAGMVRIFIQTTGTGTSDTFLLTEIFIPYNTPSATSKSLHRKLVFPSKFQLQPGYKLMVSTENAESFAVISDGMDYKYPT